MTSPNLEQRARLAAERGDWPEAERIWSTLARNHPDDPKPPFALSMHALQRDAVSQALTFWIQANELGGIPAPLFFEVRAEIAARQGDLANELDASEAALTIDPYHLPSLLRKASVLEASRQPRAAARVYRNCLKIAGRSTSSWPETLAQRLQHALDIVDADSRAYHDHLMAEIGSLIDFGPETGRWREAASIMAGVTRAFLSESNQLCVPRLPAIPFYERALFPWARELEACVDGIRREMSDALAGNAPAFTPYVAYRPGEPVNQWAELNHSKRWSTYSLWRSGEPVAEHLAACPKTAEALERVELADIDKLCPNVMFSVLAPKTVIPPHHGETNARLVAHLPLVVPEHCSYRVGFERRTWKEGELLIFDDTIEHTARNDGDQPRVVLIFDVWNPLLTIEERETVRALAAAARAYVD